MIAKDAEHMANDEDDEGVGNKRGAKKKHRYYSLCYKRKSQLLDWFKKNGRSAIGQEVEQR